jgi:4-amino-4-deoxy-L-arabinose transferase-like glycosyltransferase
MGRGNRADVTDALFGLLLFVLALAPRLYVALAWSGEPVWDGHYYDFAASRIAAGFGYSDDLVIGGHTVWHPWCHYPVGYSAFLALFYGVLGASHQVAAVVDSLTGAALAVVTWLLAREGLSRTRARIAGLLVALHPGMILYAALVMTEPLASLLTLLAFWLAVRTRVGPPPISGGGERFRSLGGRPTPSGILLGAFVLGIAALVRPQALLCVPFLAFLVTPRPSLRALGALVPVCAIALLPILPWTARNCRVMDGCALVSTNGGWNLAIGSFPRATGRFETLRSSDGCREVTGQVQQDRCWFAYGLHEIADHPLHWLALAPAKLGYTFDHESFAVEYLHEARPADWPEARRSLGRDVTTSAHRWLLCAAALGCVAFARRGRGAAVQGGILVGVLFLVLFATRAEAPTFWPLALVAAFLPWLPASVLPGAPPWPWALRLPAAFLATTLLTHVVFFGEDRYHVVVTPVLALLAAGAFRRASGPAAASLRAPAALE